MKKIELVMWIILVVLIFGISFGFIVGMILHDIPGTLGFVAGGAVAVAGVIYIIITVKTMIG